MKNRKGNTILIVGEENKQTTAVIFGLGTLEQMPRNEILTEIGKNIFCHSRNLFLLQECVHLRGRTP